VHNHYTTNVTHKVTPTAVRGVLLLVCHLMSLVLVPASRTVLASTVNLLLKQHIRYHTRWTSAYLHHTSVQRLMKQALGPGLDLDDCPSVLRHSTARRQLSAASMYPACRWPQPQQSSQPAIITSSRSHHVDLAIQVQV